MKKLSALVIGFLLLAPGCSDGGPPMATTVPRHGGDAILPYGAAPG